MSVNVARNFTNTQTGCTNTEVKHIVVITVGEMLVAEINEIIGGNMTNTAKTIFKNNVLRTMKKNNMTQAELARRIGIGRSSVNAWFGYGKSPSPKHIADIARVLGVEVKTLLKGIKVEEMI